MAPAPTPDHQWLMQEILVLLRQYIIERDIGVVLAVPVGLLIQRDPLCVRQPDILYLSAERSGIRGRAQLRGLQLLDVSPDLVVEVLSPSNTPRDMDEKLEDYRSIGVRECWLVSPDAETVEVLHLSAEETGTGAFGIEDTLTSRVLLGLSLRVRDIFV